mgnify:CR=1 FL=1
MDKIPQLLFWVFALLSPVNGVMMTMVFLIIVDFITGAYVAYKNNMPFSSKRIGHTVSKFFIYNLVILSAYFLEINIVNEVPFLKVIAGFIAITEVKSILENYNHIYGVNPFKALSNIIKNTTFKDAFENIEDKKSNTNKNNNEQ